jgi:hypothetical protein
MTSCSEGNTDVAQSPYPTATTPAGEGGGGEGSANPSNGGGNQPAAEGGQGNGNQSPTLTVLVESSGIHSPKSTGNSNRNASSATSGVDDGEDGHGLLLRVEGVILAGFVVVWIFGWL